MPVHAAAIALAMFMTGAASADCVPARPVKITTVNITPGIGAGDFRGKPKVFYRLGNGKTRTKRNRIRRRASSTRCTSSTRQTTG